MKRKPLILNSALCVVALGAGSFVFAQQNPGGAAKPMLPGTSWQVHDETRPVARIVTPGAAFSQTAPAPSDATVLFDGKDISKWQSGRGGAAQWKVESGYMEVNKTGNIRTREKFGDFQLHLEFATPSQVVGTSQERGNSGLLINGTYEVQLLDSYNNKTYADGQCGALYGQAPPLANASKPPGEWQTYDVIFESPRWDDKGEVTKKGAVTVIHNGVVLHHRKEFIGCTDGVGGVTWGTVSHYGTPHPPEVFIELQDHGNPMRFRNIWIRTLGEYDKAQ